MRETTYCTIIETTYCTIIDAIADLQARGYTSDFSLIRSKLFCAQEQSYHEPEDFCILEMYRFLPGGHTRNQTDVYAIGSLTRPLKGILLQSVVVKFHTVPS